MECSKDWIKLSHEEKVVLINEFRAALNKELKLVVDTFNKALSEKPKEIADFVFKNRRYPDHEETLKILGE